MPLDISIVKKSVLDVQADIIVNAANNSLLGGGGVDGAIHKKAGYNLYKECLTLNGCDTGDVKLTKAYDIKTSSFIAHAVGPIYQNLAKDEQDLKSCYTKSLDLMLKNNCRSIAFPCISTGVYGYPINLASKVVLDALKSWAICHKDFSAKVYICCFRDIEFNAYMALTQTQTFIYK